MSSSPDYSDLDRCSSSLPLVNHDELGGNPVVLQKNKRYSKNLDKKSRIILLIVALTTFFILALPALILYCVFKTKAVRKYKKLKSKEPHPLPGIGGGSAPLPLPAPLPLLHSAPVVLVELAQPKNASERREALSIIQKLSESNVVENLQREIAFFKEQDKAPIQAALQEINLAIQWTKAPTSIHESDIEKAKAAQEKLIQAVLNVGIQRELREKGQLVSPLDFELPILQNLGFNVGADSAYHNKEHLYEVVSRMVEEEVQVKTPSFKEVKTSIARFALRVRLKEAKLENEDQFEKFEVLYSFCQEMRINWKETHKTAVPLLLPEEIRRDLCPQRVKVLQGNFDAFKNHWVRLNLRSFIRAVKKDFNDAEKSKEDLRIRCEANRSKIKEKTLQICTAAQNLEIAPKATAYFKKQVGTLKREIEFYAKYSQFLAYEFIQGVDNEDEAMTTGVCHELNWQTQKKSQLNPQANSKEVKQEIGAKTRYRQILYQFKDGLRDAYCPEGFSAEKEKLFAVYKTATFTEELKGAFRTPANSEKLKSTVGWTLLGLHMVPKLKAKFEAYQDRASLLADCEKDILEIKEAKAEGSFHHGISVRIDRENNKYWLFDPEVGLLDFSENGGEEMLLNCLTDLIEALYSDTVLVSAETRQVLAT